MKHIAFSLLFLFIGIYQAGAQRKWELGVTVRGGTYTNASDQTQWFSEVYSQRARISRGISTSAGLYAQRRIMHGMTLSAGLEYAMSQYKLNLSMQQDFFEPGIERRWVLDATEYNVLAPLQMHVHLSRWSLAIGGTASYHIKSNIGRLEITPPNAPDFIYCGGPIYGLGSAPDFQWLWSGGLEYRLGHSTCIGVGTLMSFKKHNTDRMFDALIVDDRQPLIGRLSVFPRSLTLSLRHDLRI